MTRPPPSGPRLRGRLSPEKAAARARDEEVRRQVRATFVQNLVAAYRAAGEPGSIEVSPDGQRVTFGGPPRRVQSLTQSYTMWLKELPHRRGAVLLHLARYRFGSAVRTASPDAVTDGDLRFDCIACCGQEEPLLLRCPGCGTAWIDCMECSRRHSAEPQPRKLERGHDDRCHECNRPLAIEDGSLEPMLVTREELGTLGLASLLRS